MAPTAAMPVMSPGPVGAPPAAPDSESPTITTGRRMGEVAVGSPHYAVLFFIGVELFALTFTLNLVASVFMRRAVKRVKGLA